MASETPHDSQSMRWHAQWVLGLALGIIALDFGLISSGKFPSLTVVLDNIHWTTAYLAAAWLAWSGYLSAGAAEKSARRCFAWGLSAYAFGQVLWDVQVAVGWNPFPGPSDIFYSCLGPGFALGLWSSVRNSMERSRRAIVIMDVAALAVAVLTLTLALYLPRRAGVDVATFSLIVLVGYPVTLLTALCIGSVFVFRMPLRLSRHLVLFLVFLLMNGVIWMRWNSLTLDNALEDGTWFNLSFSFAALGLGYGAMKWRPEISRSQRWIRFSDGVLRVLPLLLVVVAGAGLGLVWILPAVPVAARYAIGVGVVVVVVLSAVRQSVQVFEGDRLLQAERRARENEGRFRALYETAQDAIFILDGDKAVDCNPSALRIFGCTREQLIGAAATNFWPEKQPDGQDSKEKAQAVFEAVESGQAQFFEWRHLRFDRTPFESEVFLSRIEIEGKTFSQAMVRDITARKEAERALRESEEKYAKVFKTAPVWIAIRKLADNTYVEVNEQALRDTGYSRAEVIGHTATEVGWISAEDRVRMLQEIQAKQGQLVDLELPIHTKDGRVLLGLVNGDILMVGGQRCLLTVTFNITDRKKSEMALQESEARFRNLSQATFEGIVLSEKGRVLDVNDQVLAMLGTERSDMIGQSILNFVAPSSRAAVTAAVQAGQESTYEHQLQKKDGTIITVEARARMMQLENRLVRMTALHDITARKQSEEALREHERYLSALVSNLPGMVYRCCNDAAWTMLFVSEGCFDLTGYKKDELEQNRIAAYGELVHPDDRDWLWAKCQASLDARTPCNNEYRIVNRAGETRWVWERAAGLYSSTGALLTIEGFITDITSRKMAESALRESEDNLRQIAENIQEVFYIVDADPRRVIYVSPAYEKSLGRSIAVLLANPLDWLEAVHPEDRARVTKAFEEHVFAGDYQETYRMVRSDGTVRWMRDKAYPVRDHTGKIIRVVGTAQDITAQRDLEQQLQQSQKLEAIGTLAGGIAHDFNNILAGIVGFNSLARNAAKGNPELLDYLDEIGRAGRRAAELVKQILAFSRVDNQTLAPVQIRLVVEEAVKLLRATIPATIEFEVKLATDLPSVMGNATQLHQVAVNLGTNAWHAMRDQPGRLRIALEACRQDEAEAQRLKDAPPGEYVRLTVADTGCGMDEATRLRIFEPFFTTKAPGEGTGLGLSVVHGIVRSHHGAIRFNSEMGRGTVFEIFIPAITTRPPEEGLVLGEQSRGHGEKILFVDDEDSLVRLGAATLTKLGYQVLVEQHAQLAWERLKRQVQDFQLVITDQTMPGLTGLELAERIRELRPELPVVLASGNSTQLPPEKLQAAGIKEVLSKPYTLENLAVVVDRHLIRKTFA